MKRRRNVRTPRRSHSSTPVSIPMSIAKRRYMSLIILAVLSVFIAGLRLHTLAWYAIALVAIGGLGNESLQQSLSQKLYLLLDEMFGLAEVVLDKFELLAVQGLQLLDDFGINSRAPRSRLLLKKTVFSYYGE